MREIWDFAVVGAGASGLVAAVTASDLGDSVILIDKNSSPGRKIAASGNGRCNLMNSSVPLYYGDPEFAEKVLFLFSAEDQMRFWNDLGLYLAEEGDGRFYPCTFQASSVLDALKIRLSVNRAEFLLKTEVLDIRKDGAFFHLNTPGETVTARRVLIAAGGKASSKLGGTDSGYKLLQSFGHHTVPAAPALCPLCTDRKSVSGLSGIRVRCTVSLYSPQHILLHREKGELLFTDSGISGICAMQCARFWEDGCTAELDLAGRLFSDRKELISTLKRRRMMISSFPPADLLSGILVPKLSYAVFKQAGIEMKNRTAGSLSEAEIRAVAQKMYAYTLQVTGTRGLEDSQVTAGGADCAEFMPETMESRLIPGLHASGEVLNVDGDCGGYNLMFAFASGALAGMNGRTGKDLVS